MRTILIPVDFSESSMNACQYAINFCQSEPALFHLYHIYNEQIMIPDSSFPSGMDIDAFFNSEVIVALKKQAEENMKEFVAKLQKLIEKSGKEIKVEHTLEGGDPQWEITEATEELKPDLVIMATSGHGKKGFLEGRMAEKIMHKAPVPVLAVPKSYSDFQLKNILYPTNFNKLDIYTLEQIINILGNRTYLIHVCHFAQEKENNEVQVLMEELEKAFENEINKGIIKCSIIKTDNKQEALATFTEYQKIDLIAILSEKKQLIQELFSSHDFHKKDFFNLDLPILAFNEKRLKL